MTRPAYVYVVTVSCGGLCKIGASMYPEKRLREIAFLAPDIVRQEIGDREAFLNITYTRKCNGGPEEAFALEDAAHELLSNRRICRQGRGKWTDWFRVRPNTAIKAIRTAAMRSRVPPRERDRAAPAKPKGRRK